MKTIFTTVLTTAVMAAAIYVLAACTTPLRLDPSPVQALEAEKLNPDVPGNAADWKRYQADSGYAISYPLAFYSMRSGTGIGHAEMLFPGVRVLEPNDAFTYQEPRREPYKLSSVARVNTHGLTLEQPAALLSDSAIVAYDPALLADVTLQTIQLDDVPALRVDNLPAGPAGITTQIVAIRGDFIYELMAEPHQITTNQAEPFVAGEHSQSHVDLLEQIYATFEFTD